MTQLTFRHLAPLLTCFVLLAVPARGDAADATQWSEDAHAAVRLIAASAVQEAGSRVMRAGVEIKLAPGWKTYWRYPGDSGVPPRFDFTRSDNVQKATVLWPAPERFSDGSGTSIGYKQQVLFPIRVVPMDASKPVVLRVNLDYAICETLCVPATADLELRVQGNAGAHDAALAASEARVPRHARLGTGHPVAVMAVRREGGSPPRVVADVSAPETLPLDLLAEGPNADWALPLPEPIAGAPAGQRRFAFELDGLPPGAVGAGATLTLTLVWPGGAIEVPVPLD
jgi:DsbC/DsbD-like thiol-disulfide interchange protein